MCVNQELPDAQAGFRKGTRTRDQIANIRWIIEKIREFQQNIYFCFIGDSLIAQLVKNPSAMQDTPVQFLGGEDPLEKAQANHSSIPGLPLWLIGKESTCNVRDLGLIPGLGRSPREGKGYPLQYSGLENSVDCIVHGVTKSQTQLTNFHFHIVFTGPSAFAAAAKSCQSCPTL